MASGGKREGGGQKPGHRFERKRDASQDTLQGQQTPVTTAIGPVDSDNAWLHAAAALRARGVSYRQIGIRFKRDPETVANRLRDNPELIEQKVRELVDPQAVFAPMVPHAAEAYFDALQDHDEPVVRAAMARDVMDRMYGKPQSKSDGSGAGINITVNFGSAPEPLTIEAAFREASPACDTQVEDADSPFLEGS